MDSASEQVGPGVGFLVAGLDFAKFGFYRFQSFCLLLSY